MLRNTFTVVLMVGLGFLTHHLYKRFTGDLDSNGISSPEIAAKSTNAQIAPKAKKSSSAPSAKQVASTTRTASTKRSSHIHSISHSQHQASTPTRRQTPTPATNVTARQRSVLRSNTQVQRKTPKVASNESFRPAPHTEWAAPTPPRKQTPPPIVPDDTEMQELEFAATAVSFRMPLDWVFFEVPYQRQIRLVVAPQRPQPPVYAFVDGMWLSYHAQPSDEVDTSLQALAEQCEELAAKATKNRVLLARTEHANLGPWPTVKTRFRIPYKDEHAPERLGFHFLARTSWGLLEIHAVTPEANIQRRERDFQRIINSLVLRQPATSPQVISPETQSAETILGSWKAYNHSMKLTGDGRIIIEKDPVYYYASFSLDNTNDSSKKPLVGRFRAQGDILVVQWSDGSGSNYRWRLHQGKLMLTDHDGRVSELHRFFEGEN